MRACLFIAVFFFSLNAACEGEDVFRIAAGSCANQNRNQVIWQPILDSQPDLFLFLGDNVYADTEDRAEMRAAYDKLNNVSAFAALRRAIPVYGIWDDHDYGENDAGREFPARVMAEEEFHRFFQTPVDDPSRQRPGIYREIRRALPGGKRLQILLLDTRYFRSPLTGLPERARHGKYGISEGPDATILGEAQWAWLEEKLQKKADLRILASSIQVIPEDHQWEGWSRFPAERERLLGLLDTFSSDTLTVILSGDRHMGEISEITRPSGRKIVELTTSGLTNAGGGRKDEPNRWRVAERFDSRNFGLIEWDVAGEKLALQLRDVEGGTVRIAELSGR